jgi:hypothetical protein
MQEMLRSVTAFALVTAGILLVASGPITAQRHDGFEIHRDAAPIDAVSSKSGQPAMFQASFIMHAFGNDTTTTGGARNLQLVTPALTHWIGPGFQDHTGHIGILRLQIVPEPGALLLLAAGAGALALLRRGSRRC